MTHSTHPIARADNCRTIVDSARYWSRVRSERQAYIFLEDGETESTKLTYRELDERARAIAATLQSVARKGDRALLLYPSGLEFITAFLGCLYAGIVAIPVYPPRSNQKITRLQAIVEDADVHFVLTTASHLEQTEGWFARETSAGNIQCLATDGLPAERAIDWRDPEVSPEDLAFLQYTSGSTGTPKGVMIDHGNLLHNEQLIQMGFGHGEKTVFVGWLPLFHDMGLIGNVLQPLYVCCLCVLMPPVAFTQKPIRWLRAISRYKATTSGGPNFAYELCVQKIKPEECTDLDLKSWDLAFNGAEPVRSETMERFSEAFSPYGFHHQAFYPCYGMAETTLFVSGGLKTVPPILYPVDRAALSENRIEKAIASDTKALSLVGCGQTFFDKIAIVDPTTGQRCAPDRVGEIWISGRSVARGYWNQPELTRQSFQAYLADTGEGPFLRTGDLGFFDRGELFITGRLKDVVIVRGRNYYPQDIERTVEQSHPALREGCGAAFSIEVNGSEQLVIVQEIERSYLRQLNSEEVFGAIRRAISDEYDLRVHAIALIKTAGILKTSSGKIQRQACKTAFLNKTFPIVGEWINPLSRKISPASVTPNERPTLTPTAPAIQARIIQWIGSELNLDPSGIGPRTAFAELGLDSINSVELAEELGSWLGVNLSATLAWDFTTIEALADHLARTVSSSRSDTAPSSSEIDTTAKPAIAPISNLTELSDREIAELLARELTVLQGDK